MGSDRNRLSRRSFLAGASLASLIAVTSKSNAFWHGYSGGASNGKLLQTNVALGNGDYPFLNAMKNASDWIITSGANTVPLLPTDFDDDNYLTNINAANSTAGVYCQTTIPSQSERPGYWILKWVGDGTVGTAVSSITPYSIQIVGVVSNNGGIQVYQLAASPSLLVAGMPIAVSGLSGGTWSGANSTVQVQATDAVNNTITINSGTTFTGTAVVSGAAKVQCVTTTTVSNGTGLTGSGRYVCMPANQGGNGGFTFDVGVTAIASATNYPHAIVVCHQNDEAALASGQIFTAKYLSIMSNFGALRDLGFRYGGSNRCNLSTWSTRKLMTHVSWASTQFRKDMFCGQTTQSVSSTGCLYSVTAPAAGLASLIDKVTTQFWLDKNSWATITSLASDGSGNTIVTIGSGGVNTTFANSETIVIAGIGNGTGSGWTACNGTFPVVAGSVSGNTLKIAVNVSAATGTPTVTSAYARHQSVMLQVGSTAAKLMADGLYSNTTLVSLTAGTTNAFCTAIYDLGLNAWIVWGAQSTTGGGDGLTSGKLYSGTPCEVIFELCGAVGAHPHMVSPCYALDNPTDWLPNLLLMAKQYQQTYPWMVPAFEPPNECWNTTFIQTIYAQIKANQSGRAWGSANINDWYGMVCSLMGQMAYAVYGVMPGIASNYSILCAWQTADLTSSSADLQRIESTAFYNAGVAPPSITVPGVGAINFVAARAAGTTAQGGTTATNWITDVVCAQYYSVNTINTTTGYPTSEATLGAAFKGAQFRATDNGDGTLTISSVSYGTVVYDGSATLLGPNANGVMITGFVSGTPGGMGTYTISGNTLIPNVLQYYTMGVDLTAPTTYMTIGAYDAVFNGSIVGNQLTINSFTSGILSPGSAIRIVGGTIQFGDLNAKIISGSYPTYTLNASYPTQSNVNFTAGLIYSLQGCMHLYANLAQLGVNHNVKYMRGYEGGCSNDYANASSYSAVDQLKLQAKQASINQTLAKTNFDNFLGRNGGLPTGITPRYPSQFLATGPWPTSGVWQVLEDSYIMPRPPIWQAIVAYQ